MNDIILLIASFIYVWSLVCSRSYIPFYTALHITLPFDFFQRPSSSFLASSNCLEVEIPLPLQELLPLPVVSPLGVLAHALALAGNDLLPHCLSLGGGVVLEQEKGREEKRHKITNL